MSRFRGLGQKVRESGEYAGKADFASVFESERAGLQKLALLLTANSEVATRCLIRAFRECISRSSVSKEWVLSWTRRMVIRKAISLVMSPGSQPIANTSDGAGNELRAFSSGDSIGAIATSESIVDLPEFERFVFVICVLERYSIHDCALLLDKSPREVDEVRHRVRNLVGPAFEAINSTQRVAMR